MYCLGVFPLQVYKIELDRNLVFIKGAVPGPNGSFVSIKDSRKQVYRRRLLCIAKITVQLTNFMALLILIGLECCGPSTVPNLQNRGV